MKRQKQVLGNRGVQVSPVSSLSFTKRFPMDTRAVLSLPPQFGGNRVTLKAKGFMELGFAPTQDAKSLAVSIKDVRLAVMPFAVGDVKVDAFQVSLGDFLHEYCYGTFAMETGAIALTFVIRLSPERIPALKQLGIFNEFTLTLTEKGRMNLQTGEFETHAEPFSLPGGIVVSGGQFGTGCKTDVELYINVVNPGMDQPRSHISEVWICPGDRVELFWESSDDVSDCDLEPGFGVVAASDHMSVAPATDTEYTITAHGNCEESDNAEVYVIEPGDEYTLIAAPDYRTGVWNVNVPPEICSPTIMITSISPSTCSWGAGVWPEWACQKIDLDGTTRYFNIIGRTSPGDIQLAGDWTFAPIVPGTYTVQSIACFTVTLRCHS